MALNINSLGGGHTHTYKDVRTDKILSKQAHISLWPERAWFKIMILNYTVYVVYLATIKLGKLKNNANWLT